MSEFRIYSFVKVNLGYVSFSSAVHSTPSYMKQEKLGLCEKNTSRISVQNDLKQLRFRAKTC